MTLIYSPAEDSYLLKEVLEKELEGKNFKILEVGVGSGFILKSLKEKRFEKIFGVDINSETVEFCKKEDLNVWKSDLFSNVKEKYNVIIFNPPYLPKTKNEDSESELATTGGINGSEVINKFLRDSKEHLNSGGKIYLLVSDLTKGINWLNWNKKLVGEKKLFFEKLEVWELRFN